MAEKGRDCRFFLRAVLFTAMITAGTPAVFSITVTVTGGYGFVVGLGDLTGGAGSGFTGTHESPDDAVMIDVAETAGDGDTWIIQVRKEDTLWHGSLDLSVVRTGSGTGTGSVSGGDVLPIELTGVDQNFFTGSGDRTAVPIKLILEGVSVLVPADSYSTTIYVTIVDS